MSDLFDKAREAAQQETLSAIKARGYVGDWTTREFMARQVAKLQEELGELAEYCLSGSSALSRDILFASEVAKLAFDTEGPEFWKKASRDITVPSIKRIREELADLQVVLFCLAEATKKFSGTNFDLIMAAVAKALDDKARGVR